MKCYYSDEQEQMVEREIAPLYDKPGEFKQVKIYPQEVYQKIIGFGGAFTEAAAFSYSKMSKKNQEKLLKLYFGESGNHYSLCRTHIQSCDFALGNYAYLDDSEDRLLKSFSIERDKQYLLPLIREALKLDKNISLLASPWSPPAFMKTNGDMNHGGKLMDAYKAMWAEMIAKYLLAYEKEGVHISRLTVQNEPAAVQTWDSCNYSGAEEAEFARDYLKPALQHTGFKDVKINVWDHNKDIIIERLEESFGVQHAKEVIDGIAFHWYTGDHFEALRRVREKYEDKELIFTEGCVEYSRFDTDSQVAHAEMYAHAMIGDLLAGANGWIDWNLYLNEEGGPNHVKNYCGAPVMCDAGKDTIDVKLSYYYIGHFSRFIRPGARRILVSSYTSDLECCGFQNVDGSIVIVILNRTDEMIEYSLSVAGSTTALTQKAHSIMTFVMGTSAFS